MKIQLQIAKVELGQRRSQRWDQGCDRTLGLYFVQGQDRGRHSDYLRVASKSGRHKWFGRWFGQWFRLGLVLSSLLVTSYCGADADLDDEPDVSALEEEQIIKNAVIPNTRKLSLVWPRADGIYPAGDPLTLRVDSAFKLSPAGALGQVIVLSNERLVYYNGQFINQEAIIGSVLIDDAETWVSESRIHWDLFSLNNTYPPNASTAEDLSSLPPGRYHVMSWAYNPLGDISHSSPQIGFYIRETNP